MNQKANTIEIIIEFIKRIKKNGLFGSKLPHETIELTNNQKIRKRLISFFLMIIGISLVCMFINSTFGLNSNSQISRGPFFILLLGLQFIFLGFIFWPWKGRD